MLVLISLPNFLLKIKNLFDSHNDFFCPHNSAHPPSLHKSYQQATILSDFLSNRGDHNSCVKPTPHFLDLSSASVDVVFKYDFFVPLNRVMGQLYDSA